MATNHEETLGEVLCEVFESFAFMFGDVVEPDEMPDVAGDCVRASMEFTGQMTGALTLALPCSMCPEIAANVLGVSPNDEAVMEKAADALKELLNITCGHVLTSIAGEEPVFDLSVPEVSLMAPAEWHALLGMPSTAKVVVDDAPAILSLSLEGEEE
jgi:Chemotaxis phosphatase CheX